MKQPKLEGWRKRFIKKFCNDHNGEVRFLRSIFWDEKDGAEEIMEFIKSELKKQREEMIEQFETMIELSLADVRELTPTHDELAYKIWQILDNLKNK